MKKNKKRTENDELRIISSSFQKLLQLDEQERKIHRAQRKEIGTIKNVMDRLCDDKDIKERMAKDEELSILLQQARDLISSIRTLIRQWPPYSLRLYSCGELFYPKKIIILSDNGSLLSYAENLMDKTVIMNKCERICM